MRIISTSSSNVGREREREKPRYFYPEIPPPAESIFFIHEIPARAHVRYARALVITARRFGDARQVARTAAGSGVTSADRTKSHIERAGERARSDGRRWRRAEMGILNYLSSAKLDLSPLYIPGHSATTHQDVLPRGKCALGDSNECSRTGYEK